MNDFFKLKENKTTARTEIIAGITTFFTMAYIIFVNPQILSATGMDFNSVLIATCIAAAIGTLLIGLLANYPFAQAPGMGLNAFFTYTVVFGMGYTWEQALAAVFISGLVFIVITVTGLRSAIVRAIPLSLKKAIGAGIGLFIALIGLNNSGIIELRRYDAAPGYLEFGNFAAPAVLLAVIGLIITSILVVRKVKGALFIGIIVTTIIGIPMKVSPVPTLEAISEGFKNITLAPTFMKMDIPGLLNLGDSVQLFGAIVAVLTVILSFTIVDMFDTIGTLIGTADKGGFLDKDGNLPRINKALLADSVATSVGAVLGTSTVTTYIESASGISEGGKTGLTSVVTAILFLLAIIIAPIAGIIPLAATSPVLIIVGVLMMGTIKSINFDDFEEALPAFLTMVIMPFAYSIADGIAAGFIFYVVVKMARGKFKEVHPIMYGLAIIFILRLVLMLQYA